jgi:hypothetical protein
MNELRCNPKFKLHDVIYFSFSHNNAKVNAYASIKQIEVNYSDDKTSISYLTSLHSIGPISEEDVFRVVGHDSEAK